MVPDASQASPSIEAPKLAPAVAVRRAKPQPPATVRTLEIPLAQIEEDPDNARIIFDAERIKARAASMREVGQLQPAIVRSMGAGKYRLVDGALRFRAAPLAGLRTLRCEVLDLTSIQAALAAATANLQRENLTEYEEARGFHHLIELSKKTGSHYTMADVARLTDKAPNTIKNRLKVYELGDEIGRRIGINGFGSIHAQALEPLVKHPELLKPVLAAIDDGAGIPTAGNMRSFIRGALERAKVAVEPSTAIDYSTRGSIPNFDAKVAALPHTELANEHGSPTILVDPKVLAAGVKAWKADVRAREAKEEAKAKAAVAKRGSPPPGPKPQKKRAEDLAPYKVRDAQIQLLAQNAKELTKWNDDLQMALVGAFLRGAPAVTRKLDRQALLDASGLDENEVDSLLRFGNSNAVAKLWPKKRLPIARLCMVMAAYSHWSTTQVNGSLGASDPHWVDYLGEPWDKLFTGLSHVSVKAKMMEIVKSELAGGRRLTRTERTQAKPAAKTGKGKASKARPAKTAKEHASLTKAKAKMVKDRATKG